jgi:triosephosphate isomerase
MLICGNWKMNGRTADGVALARAIATGPAAPWVDLAICPPATLIAAIVAAVVGAPVAVGGQDCHAKPSGAFTGDIAAPMLADLGCRYVIVGHSERRTFHRESDAEVRAKAEAAAAAGLIPIICVGETLAERDEGRMAAVIRAQIAGSLAPAIPPDRFVIAYEPVWAIGTGRTATAAQVAEVHALIRADLADGARVRILYGGSVKPDNAAELLALADVDGALVGGASLDAKAFLAIAAAAPRS